MYELTHEPQLKGRMSWGVYDDDYDYDVDVYLWYPSSRPSIAELAGVENGFELPFVFERQADDQLDDATSYLPPPSPSYSVASDFVFPEGSCQQEMDKAGYSKFFSSVWS